jgi:hypothetical protein
MARASVPVARLAPHPRPASPSYAERAAFGIGRRLAITLALPHRVHRSRFTKLATGASDLILCDLSSDGDNLASCRHRMQVTVTTP